LCKIIDTEAINLDTRCLIKAGCMCRAVSGPGKSKGIDGRALEPRNKHPGAVGLKK